MQTKKHQKNNSKKLTLAFERTWAFFVLFAYIIFSPHVPHTPCHARQERTHAISHTLRMFRTLHAAPDRNGCWLQSSVFVRIACAALGTSPSFDAQPTLLSSIAHQRNFGSRQTHGEKHRNPARGKRNFWLLFLPWKSNTYNVCHKAAISTGILRTPKETFGYFSFHGKVTPITPAIKQQ